MATTARTPEEYMAAMPPDRRHSISAVRDVIRENLPEGFEEGIEFGMIAWYVPLERFPDTYNGRPLGLAALASQKQYMSLYLNTVYGDPQLADWFKDRYAQSGKRLDMGKSCVRFRALEDLSLDVVGETIAKVPLDQYVAYYQAARGSSRRARAAADG
jgi:hypothetical protein